MTITLCLEPDTGYYSAVDGEINLFGIGDTPDEAFSDLALVMISDCQISARGALMSNEMSAQMSAVFDRAVELLALGIKQVVKEDKKWTP